ncbi:MAG: imidazole glycerol phosphate synthase subunit HisH [Clostridiales bacterium]|nr:imidazole glycerol phosphate synthase subunit HisH [Clostridiales bacterium]
MISIIDYGMGNLRSVQKAFEYLGYEAIITHDSNAIDNASHVVLPGVGAFQDAIKALVNRNLVSTIEKQIDAGKPFLGICLGMQLLFEKSYEHGEHKGLGIFNGEIVRFDLSSDYKVPHMGWNEIKIKQGEIFDQDKDDQYVYFVHSYHVKTKDRNIVAATTEYGYEFVAAVCKDNIFATQFHPEKSGDTGLAMLKRFGELK